MSDQKWDVGPVKLFDGRDAVIHRFCEKRHQYIGEFQDSTGRWYASEWTDLGWYSKGIGQGDLTNLVPHPKKTLRVRFWLNVYDGAIPHMHGTREEADENAAQHRFACIEIDREVEEGEGLEPNVRRDAANMRRAKQ